MLLHNKHYLLILDDVWTSSFTAAFPEPATDSNHLVTSRKKGILRHCKEVDFSNKAYSEDVATRILASYAMENGDAVPAECQARHTMW